MTTRQTQLGAFELYESIGAGGMGIVYRAQHRETGADAAVKVVRGEPDDRAQRRFTREVQSHAALLHPSIVQLLDYGEVDELAATSSGGALREGSPYVAMELAEGGTVADYGLTTWSQVHRVLQDVLKALAHAHARGVIHRDLKPANLLVFGSGDAWHVKLTDFGIAHALQSVRERGHESLASIIGTPKYMAAEQLLGRWRDHGPWTDLYALGCIAFEIASGRPAYENVKRGGGVREAVEHLTGPPPPLEPSFGVPADFHDWVRKAMDVSPDARFQRASEALAALPAAGAPTSLAGRPPSARPDPGEDDTVTDATALLPASRPQNDISAATRPDSADVPPPPEDWRSFDERGGLPRGVGLGLVGLREPGFVGRETERDVIWDAYCRTVNGGPLEVVLIEGEAGIGKTRLAEWAMTLAHEVGSAQVVEIADFTRDVEGLESALRTWMMRRADVYEHLLRTLPPLESPDRTRDHDARALTELLKPTSAHADEGGPRFEFSSSSEKLVVLGRLVRRLALERPTIVFVDDLPEAAPALGFVEYLTRIDQLANVLVLATARSDSVAARESVGERFDDLAASDRVHRLPIDVLSEDESRHLAGQLAAIPESGVEALVERMEGNPLFGVQLLTDWVERDLVGAMGEGPSSEALDQLPADIHAVWVERIRRLEHGVEEPGRFRKSLELAATLGLVVTRRDWEAVSEVAAPTHPQLWDKLVERGLARSTDDGWRFAHGLFVRSVRRIADEAGRMREHSLRCATGLEAVFADEPLRVAGRLADLWIAGGRPEKALAPLLEEVERHRRADDPQACRRTLKLREQLLDDLRVPPDDLQRLWNDVEVLADALRLGVPPEEVLAGVHDLIDRMSSRNAPEIAARAWRIAALCREGQLDFDAARGYARRSIEAGREWGGGRYLVLALLGHARIELRAGNGELARARTDEAREAVAAVDDPYLRLRVTTAAGWAALECGDNTAAKQIFDDVLGDARELSWKHVETDALNGLGELARIEGAPEKAIGYYEQAIEASLQMQQHHDAAVYSINLAAAELMVGDFEVAAERLREGAERLHDFGFVAFDAHLALCRLAIAAGRDDVAAFDVEMEKLRAFLADEDSRWTADDLSVARVACDYAEDASEPRLQEEAGELLRRLGASVGDE